MPDDDELVEDVDERLVLLHSLLARGCVLLDHEEDWIERVLEPHQADQVEVLSPPEAADGQRDACAKQGDGIGDQPEAQVDSRRLLKRGDLADKVNSVEVDEEVDRPKDVKEDFKSEPVHACVLVVVEVFGEADRQRRHYDILEDDQGEKAVPHLHRVRVDIELVPLRLIIVHYFGLFVRV